VKSAAARARLIEAEIRRTVDLKSRIDKLQKSEQESVSAIAAETEALVIDLAKECGLLDLPPSRIVAVFDRLLLETVASEGVTEVVAQFDGASRAASEEPIDGLSAEAVVHVTIKFGNYAKSAKVALLQSIPGLTRNGKLGIWHGQVDRAAVPELRQIFGSRLKTAEARPKRLAEAVAMRDASSASEEPSQFNADVVRDPAVTAATMDSLAAENAPLAEMENEAERPTAASDPLEALQTAESESRSPPVEQVPASGFRSPFFGMHRRPQIITPGERSSDT
jgi:hypothetical protein